MCDISTLLSPNALQELYSGIKNVKIQENSSLSYCDNFVCQDDRHMTGLIPGDLVETEKAFCIKIPQLERTSALLDNHHPHCQGKVLGLDEPHGR